MLERDAEVHLVLPFATEDFIRERVAPAGARWERRFRHALKLVASVTHATEEHYLGHDWLFRFNNQIIDGLARLRADLWGRPRTCCWSGTMPPNRGPGRRRTSWTTGRTQAACG
jgi:hypothetical protein